MRAIYTNKFGKRVVENVDRFDFCGTIMTASVNQVTDNAIVHRIYIEDSGERYCVNVWNTCKGYNPSGLKCGHSIRVKGVVHHNWINGKDNRPFDCKQYSVQEMSLA